VSASWTTYANGEFKEEASTVKFSLLYLEKCLAYIDTPLTIRRVFCYKRETGEGHNLYRQSGSQRKESGSPCYEIKCERKQEQRDES